MNNFVSINFKNLDEMNKKYEYTNYQKSLKKK